MASTPSTPARNTSKARRPSDGPSNGPGGNARGHGQSSPRVRMMLKEEEARPVASAKGATPRLSISTADQQQQQQQQQQQTANVSSKEDDDGVGAKTFLTALVAAKHAIHGGSKHAKENPARDILRPPSPLEPMNDGIYGGSSGGGGNGNEPCVQNYMGAEAMQKFWGMFHRHDAVSNNASTSLRGSGESGSKENLLPLVVSTRPKSARSTYLSVVRKLQLSPEPLGIVWRRVLEKGASSSVSSTASSSSACSSGNTAQGINLNSYHMGDAGRIAQPGAQPHQRRRRGADHHERSERKAADVAPAAQPGAQQALVGVFKGALRALAPIQVAHIAGSLTHPAARPRDPRPLRSAAEEPDAHPAAPVGEQVWHPGRGLDRQVSRGERQDRGSVPGVEPDPRPRRAQDRRSAQVPRLPARRGPLVELAGLERAAQAPLSDSLANNKVLVHLDISNNHLGMDDCALLAKHLENNHTLVGLHMSGNCGVIDSRGFLIAKKTESKLLDQHKMYSIAVFEESHSESGSGSFPTHLAPLVDKFCWYCGQWSEYRFAWQPTSESGPFAGSSDRFEITPSMGVRLHLCHDDWRGVDMEKREDGSFSAYTILPPGKPMSHHYIHEKRYTRLVHLCSSGNGNGDREKQRVFGDLKFVNVVRTARREGRDPCNTLVPRSTGKNSERATRWDINKSVFARRRRESVCRNFVDTDPFVSKACAADWRQCKVDRFTKDPARRKDVENCVTRHFRITSNAYRRYCGHNVLASLAGISVCTASVANQLQNDVISVPWSGYLEFLSECRILDESSDYCKSADLENVFVAANLELTQEAKEKDNPDRSLTRFKFLECVICISMTKYHRSKALYCSNVCDTPAKAVEKLILEHIQPVCREDPNEFRAKFLYTEEVSDIFSEHIVMSWLARTIKSVMVLQLQDIYNSNMGKYCKPGEKKGMQLAEFLQIMEKYQVYNDQFRVRDVKDPFLACKLVVLDEMVAVGHKELYMTDFMELLLRISTIRYPPKPLTVVEVAKGLQKLFVNHFYKHEEILDQFREAVDQAVVQDRIEAFASAINAQKKNKAVNDSGGGAKRGSGRSSNARKHSQSLAEREDEDEEEDSDALSGGEEEEPRATTTTGSEPSTAVTSKEGEGEPVPVEITKAGGGNEEQPAAPDEVQEKETQPRPAAVGSSTLSIQEPGTQDAELPAG